jgi:hypothetical protein
VGILTELFVSDEQGARAYDSDAGDRTAAKNLERSEFTGLLDLNFSILWAILEDKPWDIEVHALEERALSDDGERWLFRFPDKLVQKLAALDQPTLAKAAAAWSQTEELHCQPGDVQPVIVALVALSRSALAGGKNLYLWGSL